MDFCNNIIISTQNDTSNCAFHVISGWVVSVADRIKVGSSTCSRTLKDEDKNQGLKFSLDRLACFGSCVLAPVSQWVSSGNSVASSGATGNIRSVTVMRTIPAPSPLSILSRSSGDTPKNRLRQQILLHQQYYLM